MALITRRRFVQQTAFCAAALYGRRMKLLGEGRRIPGEREQYATPIDAARSGREDERGAMGKRSSRQSAVFSHGLNTNKLSDTNGELVRAAYGPNYARLVEIKKRYDPTNMLRLNRNIRP